MDRPAAGAYGPRLAGRLTAELILRSPQYMNAIKQYELDLRGNKLGAIENLGATENQFDSIDLSDNAIVKLEGFPRLPRLRMLLLNNNRILRIAKGLETSLPNLETLVLTNNKLNNLSDVDPLAALAKLSTLSLMGCPVATRPHYRLYVISKCKHLKVLDYRKVRLSERTEAAKLFGDAATAAAHAAKTFEPSEDYEKTVKPGQPAPADQVMTEQEPAAAAAAPGAPTPAQLLALKAAIANAATLEEVRRLETALATGHMPSDFQFSEGQAAGAEGAAAMDQD